MVADIKAVQLDRCVACEQCLTIDQINRLDVPDMMLLFDIFSSFSLVSQKKTTTQSLSHLTKSITRHDFAPSAQHSPTVTKFSVVSVGGSCLSNLRKSKQQKELHAPSS